MKTFYLFFLLIPNQFRATKGQCIVDYQDLFKEKSIYCYKMIKSREHEEARKKCEEDKGDLATFHSEQEENYFTDKEYSRHRFGYRKHADDWLALDSNDTIKVEIRIDTNGECMKQENRTFISTKCKTKSRSVCQRHKTDYHGYIKKLFRKCTRYTDDFANLRDAEDKCNKDIHCTYISADNLGCNGPYALCKGTKVEYERKGCIMQKAGSHAGTHTTKHSSDLPNEGDDFPILYIIIIIVFVVTFAVVVAVLVYKRLKSKSKKLQETRRSSFNSLRNSCTDGNKRFDSCANFKSQVNLSSHTTKREISRSLFTITKHLGSGYFGTVSKGELTGLYGSNSKTTVAIKSLKGPAEGAELRDFLQEIKIMSNTNAHLNLVSMIGSCSSELENEKEVWLIIEFCRVGDLKTFLVENKKRILKIDSNDLINDKCLLHWAHDVSKGMEFLSKQNIMHGDLAARNIMLDENHVQFSRHIAKIADFGLSKRFYNNLEYEKQTRNLIPWKWMAYEFLTCDYFTLTSDVWSFGVVLWEIFSFGKTPYGQKQYDEVISQLESGNPLSCPSEVKGITSWDPEIVYEDIKKLCFIEDPNERGTFSQVVETIERHLSEDELSLYQEMEEKYQTERSNYYMQLVKNKT